MPYRYAQPSSEALRLSQIKKAVSDVEAQESEEARARAELAAKAKENAETFSSNADGGDGDPGATDPDADKEPELDPSKMTGPDPENREADQDKKTAKRGRPSKKDKK